MSKNLVNRLFVALSLIVLFDALIPQIITFGGRVLTDHYRMIMNIICLIIFLYATTILIFNYEKIKRALTGSHLYLSLLFIWIYLSHLWSNNIYATFESSVLLTFTLAFVIYSFVFLRRDEFWKVLYTISLVISIVSFLLIFLLPVVAVMPEGYHEGDWRGVFLHKNALGNYMAIMNIIFLVAVKRKFKVLLSLLGYVLSWILIIGSGSKTSFASVLFIHVILFFLYLIKTKKVSFRLILSFSSIPVVLGVILIVLNYQEIALFLGGDVTLTGRIPLWYNVVQALTDAPVLGYGYGAFWGYESGSEKFMSDMIWESGKSHNAFLDVWLDLGVIGLVLFIGFIGSTLTRLLKYYRNKDDKYSETYLLIMLMIISVSMIDFRILYYNSIIFFLIAYIYMYSLEFKTSINTKWKLVKVKRF